MLFSLPNHFHTVYLQYAGVPWVCLFWFFPYSFTQQFPDGKTWGKWDQDLLRCCAELMGDLRGKSIDRSITKEVIHRDEGWKYDNHKGMKDLLTFQSSKKCICGQICKSMMMYRFNLIAYLATEKKYWSVRNQGTWTNDLFLYLNTFDKWTMQWKILYIIMLCVCNTVT